MTGYQGSAELRRRLRARDGDDCYVCGLFIDPAVPPGTPQGETVEHVIPRSMGGSSSMSNLRLSHGRCNVTRTYEEVDDDVVATSALMETNLDADAFAGYAREYVLRGQRGSPKRHAKKHW